ncbi:MAG: Ldh family oxidoreductase [Chlamydiales bacterium]|nr:Ldh family oxidoreductase [Chlamydiales bacterium]
MRVAVSLLKQNVASCLMKYGVKKGDASTSADVLVEGTLRGYSQHGVDRIFQIVEGFKNGTVNPRSLPAKRVDFLSATVFDAEFGLGYPIGKKAMEEAIDKARETGVGVSGVINSSHLGYLGYYAELASTSGCVGLVMTVSSPAVVIKGGKKKTFGTNPIAYSFPHDPHPITADFSTSKATRGKVFQYLSEGKPLPPGWAVDVHGVETTDPFEALEGGLLPLEGGVKGSMLSLLVSVLAGSLIGGVINPHVTGTRYMSEKPNKGDLFIAFHIESFTDSRRFSADMRALSEWILSDEADFRIPGSRAHTARTELTVEIDQKTADFLELSMHGSLS